MRTGDAAETARLKQSAHWNPETLTAHVAPGTPTEESALARIDTTREIERDRLLDTPASRRRRAKRFWRPRLAGEILGRTGYK